MESVRKVYVGIDVHRLKHQAVILSCDQLEAPVSKWKDTKTISLGNNRKDYEFFDLTIKEFSSSPEEVAIAIDRTGRYSETLVWFLRGKGYHLYYIEPRGIQFAREKLLDMENKTDVSDAASFAYLLYLQDKHGLSFRVSKIEAELEDDASLFRSLYLQQRQYSKLIVQTTNRLRMLFTIVFPEAERRYFTALTRLAIDYPLPKNILFVGERHGIKPAIRGLDKIIALASETIGVQNENYAETIRYYAELLAEAKVKKLAIEKTLEEKVRAHPYGSILLSFPRVGITDAALLISNIKDISRWENDRKLKKALGVYPIIRRSGKSQGRPRLGIEGDGLTRSALVRITMLNLIPHTQDNDFRDYYIRGLIKGKPKLKALVSTAGKLAETLFHCLSNNEFYAYQGVYRVKRIPKALQEKYLPDYDIEKRTGDDQESILSDSDPSESV